MNSKLPYYSLNAVDRWARAREFAAEAHKGQMYGSEPYTAHLGEVAEILHEAGFIGTDEMVVGYFHDLLEDTQVTVENLRDFGLHEADIDAIQFCTDEPGATRKARKTATYERVRRHLADRERGFYMGLVAKYADRIANMRACRRTNNQRLLDMYLKESPLFKEVYHLPANPEDVVFTKLMQMYEECLEP